MQPSLPVIHFQCHYFPENSSASLLTQLGYSYLLSLLLFLFFFSNECNHQIGAHRPRILGLVPVASQLQKNTYNVSLRFATLTLASFNILYILNIFSTVYSKHIAEVFHSMGHAKNIRTTFIILLQLLAYNEMVVLSHFLY